jgi:hypothetical protein
MSSQSLVQMPPRVPALDARVVQEVLLAGDLGKLNPEQRIAYYNRVCETLGLNPLTQPFAYLRLSGKEVLYAKKDATEQLRMIHGVSITEVTSTRVEDVFVVTAKAMNREGRTDASTGAVALGTLKGEQLANALMKAETKAKRRVTLSICGLGMLDETEVETIKQDPPALVIEDVPAVATLPPDCSYIVRVDLKRKKNYEWADVTLHTGEVLFAQMQIVKLLEQVAQEKAPVLLTTEVNKKGNLEIIEAQRWKPEAPAEPVTLPAGDLAF